VIILAHGAAVLAALWPAAHSCELDHPTGGTYHPWDRARLYRLETSLTQRDTIRQCWNSKWRQAVLLTAVRLGFDFGCLLTALRATTVADPRALPGAAILLRRPHRRRGPPINHGRTRLVGGKPQRPADPGRASTPAKRLPALSAYRVASSWLPLLAGRRLPLYLTNTAMKKKTAARPSRHAGQGWRSIVDRLR